jgi:hypothetical protein
LLTRLAITLSLGIAACLALAAALSVPEGVNAARAIAAADDPARIADLALDKQFNAMVATREIEEALGAGDTELARSFVELAAERAVALPPALLGKIESVEQDAAQPSSQAASFARGFITGKPEDIASAAGMLTGDLFVFGDVRDVVREGWHGLRGEAVDKVVLGLAGTGIAVTAGVYASAGLAAPARAGLSVIKAAKRTERVGLPLLRLLKLEKREKLVAFVSDLGKVRQRAGMRGALDSLKVSEHPKDVARLASLAAVKGTKTRAVVKLLGRGAIFLTSSMFTLASWVLWALLNLFAFCAACKRTAERITLRHCERRRTRRLRLELERSRQKSRPVLPPAARPEDQRLAAAAQAA